MGRNNEQYRNRLSHDRISFVWKFVLVLREIITVLVQGNGVKTEYKFVSDDNSYIYIFFWGEAFSKYHYPTIKITPRLLVTAKCFHQGLHKLTTNMTYTIYNTFH